MELAPLEEYTPAEGQVAVPSDNKATVAPPTTMRLEPEGNTLVVVSVHTPNDTLPADAADDRLYTEDSAFPTTDNVTVGGLLPAKGVTLREEVDAGVMSCDVPQSQLSDALATVTFTLSVTAVTFMPDSDTLQLTRTQDVRPTPSSTPTRHTTLADVAGDDTLISPHSEVPPYTTGEYTSVALPFTTRRHTMSLADNANVDVDADGVDRDASKNTRLDRLPSLVEAGTTTLDEGLDTVTVSADAGSDDDALVTVTVSPVHSKHEAYSL